MSLLLTKLKYDLFVQFRAGFYLSAAGAVAMQAVLIYFLPDELVYWAFPAFIATNLMLNNFYFIAGQIFLEKDEGSLLAQLVAPVGKNEYILSKLLTLGLLSVVENTALCVAAMLLGLEMNLPLMIVSIVVLSIAYLVIGFLFSSLFDSINRFYFPASVVSSAIVVPGIIYYLQLVNDWWMFLYPVLGPLVLMSNALTPGAGESWHLPYTVAYVGIFLLAIWWLWRDKAFNRMIQAVDVSE